MCFQEGGLLGSQAIAQAYKAVNADIYAMIQVRKKNHTFIFDPGLIPFSLCQMDMTAWVKKGTREEVGMCHTSYPFIYIPHCYRHRHCS